MTRNAGAWFRQPIFWIGAAIFVASLVACVVTIVLASRHADAPVETGGGKVVGMPLRDAATASPQGSGAR